MYLANITVTYGPQNLDTILEKIFFPHLKQINHFGTIPPLALLAVSTDSGDLLELSNVPTRNRTLGNMAHIRGAVAMRRSMPFLYANLRTTTIVTVGMLSARSTNG